VYITSLAVRRDHFTFDVAEIPQGTGSGFLWDAQGHVVTNFHVIQNASSAQITLEDQSSYPATLVGVAIRGTRVARCSTAPGGSSA